MSYVIEKQKGNVRLHDNNCLVKDLDDMQELEYWEDRLEKFGNDYTIAYRKIKGKFLYSIFTLKRGGIF